MHKLLLGGAIAAIVAAAAVAQPAPPPPPGVAQGTQAAPQIQTFVHRMPMKTETRDEVTAHVREMFARLDANKDGAVTREEADAAHRAMAGEMHKFTKRFEAGDFPHPDRGAMFDRLDTNKDGSISRQEFMSARPEVRRESHVFVMRDGAGPVEVGGEPGAPGVKVMRFHHSGFGIGMHKKMFERADANHDGRVSLQEMTAAALRHFDEADSNHDGKLTPEERMKMHEGRRMQVQRIPA
ncbi:MAG TPA: EF-hand domain-containing protein [Sphingomicrobium sp.]